MTTIQINDDDLVNKLDKLAGRMNNLKPLADAIALSLLAVTDDNFVAQGRPSWQGLSPKTLAARRKRGIRGTDILQETKALRSRITTSTSPATVAIGSNLPYAAIQHYGGKTRTRSRQHTLYFKMKNGVVGSRFVKKSKSNFAQTATIPGHEITVPARPYLPMTIMGTLQHEAVVAIHYDVDIFLMKSI